MEFAYKIFTLRENKGYSLKAVAKALNVNAKEVEEWEKGEKVPDLSMTMRIASFYEIDVDILLDDSKEVISEKIDKKDQKIRSAYWTYSSLVRKKKVIPVILDSLFGLPLFIIGLIFYIPNFNRSSAQLLATIGLVMAIIGFVMIFSIPIRLKAKIKEYRYEGHNILCYHSLYTTFLIVDGYVKDYPGAARKENKEEVKTKYPVLKTRINDKTIVMKIDDSKDIILETEDGFRLKEIN